MMQLFIATQVRGEEAPEDADLPPADGHEPEIG